MLRNTTTQQVVFSVCGSVNALFFIQTDTVPVHLLPLSPSQEREAIRTEVMGTCAETVKELREGHNAEKKHLTTEVNKAVMFSMQIFEGGVCLTVLSCSLRGVLSNLKIQRLEHHENDK